MRKIIAVCGPTAVGKTKYAIEAAKAFGGEVVSCDSMQLYKYMDIGSAKIMPEEMQKIKDVYDAAEQGDEVAKEIFDFTGTILGQQLADFIAFSAPEAIILFGGLTKSGHWIKDPVEKAMNENVLPLWRNKVQVLFSDLKEADAAVLGASALAWGD